MQPAIRANKGFLLRRYRKDCGSHKRSAIVVQDSIKFLIGHDASMGNLFNVRRIISIACSLGVHPYMTTIQHHGNLLGHKLKGLPRGLPEDPIYCSPMSVADRPR